MIIKGTQTQLLKSKSPEISYIIHVQFGQWIFLVPPILMKLLFLNSVRNKQIPIRLRESRAIFNFSHTFIEIESKIQNLYFVFRELREFSKNDKKPEFSERNDVLSMKSFLMIEKQ